MSIKVLIVDNSPFIREAIKAIFSVDDQIEVIGEANNGKEAVECVRTLSPDVVTMNIWMPVMNGFQAIEEIMKKCPVPIVVVSSKQADIGVKALSLGAMEYVELPCVLMEMAAELLEKVHIVSHVKALKRLDITKLSESSHIYESSREKKKIIVIGTSTGGPQALQALLSVLPEGFPASIVVVQHIADGFITVLVDWLKQFSKLDLLVADGGEEIKQSTVYFAPSGCNLIVSENNSLALRSKNVSGGVNLPSVDETMKSIASFFGKDAVGVIMTGMGDDGTEGIKLIKNAGGRTIAQDEASSIIYGMNKSAIESGSIDEILPLKDIASRLISLCI